MGIDVHPSLAHLALYVRAACRLPVAAAPGIPPPLAGNVPDRSDLLEPNERADAAARWVRWWEAIVAYEGASELGVLVLPTDPRVHLETLGALGSRLLDWPELEVLADEPALQRVVRALHDEGSRWSAERAWSARTAGRPGRSPLPPGLAPAVAEEVIERSGVRPGRVRAGVLVLGVEGHFAHLASPGVLVCSEATARDAARIRPLLEEAFRSGIDALEVEVRAMTPRRAPLPASVLAVPIAFGGDGELELTLDAVLPYANGFELLLRRRGGGPPPPEPTRPPGEGRKRDPWGRPDRFVGLALEVAFADGRSARVEDLAGLDVDGDVILTRFWRDGGEDELWLWVAPLPPAGPVTVRADWLAFEIRGAVVGFEGALLCAP
jgi:hypothetical protein